MNNWGFTRGMLAALSPRAGSNQVSARKYRDAMWRSLGWRGPLSKPPKAKLYPHAACDCSALCRKYAKQRA